LPGRETTNGEVRIEEGLLLLGDAIVKPDKHQGREKSDSNSANKQQHNNFLRGFLLFF
jgi:hypothetical protein